jgi:hypothetical protein
MILLNITGSTFNNKNIRLAVAFILNEQQLAFDRDLSQLLELFGQYEIPPFHKVLSMAGKNRVSLQLTWYFLVIGIKISAYLPGFVMLCMALEVLTTTPI